MGDLAMKALNQLETNQKESLKTFFNIDDFHIKIYEVLCSNHVLHNIQFEHVPTGKILIIPTGEGITKACGIAVSVLNGVGGYAKIDVKSMWHPSL